MCFAIHTMLMITWCLSLIINNNLTTTSQIINITILKFFPKILWDFLSIMFFFFFSFLFWLSEEQLNLPQRYCYQIQAFKKKNPPPKKKRKKKKRQHHIVLYFFSTVLKIDLLFFYAPFPPFFSPLLFILFSRLFSKFNQNL